MEISSNIIDQLMPKAHQRVMDLLEEAGHDISDWSNFKSGPERAASNPRYCYEWAFYQPNKPVVLNLWHSQLQLSDDNEIYQQLNMRAYSSELSAIKGKKKVSSRAFQFDEALKHSLRDGLGIRAVICEGSRSDAANREDSPSRVDKRLLDAEPWSVAKYDMMTGMATIVRGVTTPYIDQHHQRAEAIRRKVAVEVFHRQRRVRDAALARANGRCDYCDCPGFKTADGSIYLESHHVTPLSRNGDDNLSNVVALCANDHRKAHFGEGRETMERDLHQLLRDKYSNNG